MDHTQPAYRADIPLDVFPIETVMKAALVCDPDLEVDVASQSAGFAHIRLMPRDHGMDETMAQRLFRRELLAAAVNRWLRTEERVIQRLFAGSALSISTERLRWVDELREDAGVSPNIAKGTELADPRSFPESGYVAEIDHSKASAFVRMDPARYLLPVVLSAVKRLKPDIQVTVVASGVFTGATLVPAPGISPEEALDRFLNAIGPWELPRRERRRLGDADLDTPVDPAFIEAAARSGHPAAPGDLPLTYSQVTYPPNWGVSLPYRLGEIFTQEIAPNRILVSTRYRTWAVVNEKQYRALMEMRAHEDEEAFWLYEALGIILSTRNLLNTARLSTRRYGFMHAPPALSAPRVLLDLLAAR